MSIMSLPRSKRTWSLLIAAVAVFLALLVFFLRPTEPSYKGKRLGYWLDYLPATLLITNGGGGTARMVPFSYKTAQDAQADEARRTQLMRDANEAIDALGTNCFRTLVARLGSTDSRASSFAYRWSVRLGLRKPRPNAWAEIRRGQALTALARLDSRAKFMNGRDKLIVPDLLALTKHNNPGVRAAALHALREIAPDEYRRLEGQGQLTRK